MGGRPDPGIRRPPEHARWLPIPSAVVRQVRLCENCAPVGGPLRGNTPPMLSWSHDGRSPLFQRFDNAAHTSMKPERRMSLRLASPERSSAIIHKMKRMLPPCPAYRLSRMEESSPGRDPHSMLTHVRQHTATCIGFRCHSGQKRFKHFVTAAPALAGVLPLRPPRVAPAHR